MASDSNDQYQGQKFKILGKGQNGGDARIKLPSGKMCFVKGVPDSLNKLGNNIEITGHREGRGNTDFASYHVSKSTTGAVPASIAASGVEVYLLHIGPTMRADESAIAVCNKDVLDMKAHDALVYLVRKHDDKTVFAESTDRRIAAGLNDLYKRAESENAIDEVALTLNNEAITPKTDKKLKDYFRLKDGNYRASAIVSDSHKEVPTAGCCQTAPKSGPKVMTAKATAVRKGSPGGDLEYRII